MVQLVRGPHAPCPLPPGRGGGARGKRPTPARRAHAHAFGFTVIFYFRAIMAKIRQDIIDHILDIAKIEEVVADFPDVKLKKQAGGVRYVGICPFHDDKGYGNFSVYPKENVYKCFRCEAAGDPVKFIMEHEKLSFPDAIRWLGKKFHSTTSHRHHDRHRHPCQRLYFHDRW